MSEQKYTLSTRQFPLVDKKAKPPKFNCPGITLRIGPSDLTGDTIATIAVFVSLNDKTGNVVQVYCIPVDEHPIEAIDSGLDTAVCGNCPLKPSNDNVCYVRKFHGPARVYDTFKRGRYPLFADLSKANQRKVWAILESKPLRLGAWGDPAADSFTSEFLASPGSQIPNVLSYSHQWRKNPQLKPFTMASVDSPQEYIEAKELGWRTYRHTFDDTAFENEIVCPHSSHGTQCVDCGLCSGTNSGSDKDIVTKTI